MKLRSTAVGLMRSKFRRSPFYVRYHITHRCNYHCGMCGQRSRTAKLDELALPEIERVAGVFYSLGARHAVITGGEPFLREDLHEAIALFAARGFSVRVQTNGGPQVTRERLARCVAAGLEDVSVSIDTLDPGLQDRLCGSRNVLPHALRTLALARELLPHGMSLANIVASRYNFGELPSLVHYFQARSVYTYITPVMIAGPAVGGDSYRFRSSDMNFYPDGMGSELVDKVVDGLVALRRSGMGLTNSTRFLQDYRRYLGSGYCDWRCEAGQVCLDVYPDGGVSICKEKPPFASVLAPGFQDFYRKGDFRRQAREISSACEGCFYGEYREPQYALRDVGVFSEWVRDWAVTFRRGMGFRPVPAGEPTWHEGASVIKAGQDKKMRSPLRPLEGAVEKAHCAEQAEGRP